MIADAAASTRAPSGRCSPPRPKAWCRCATRASSRARVEDPAERAARRHQARTLRTWTADDGMLEGHFRLAPEVGGRFKAALDNETQRIFRSRRASGPHESPDAYAADALMNLIADDGVATKRTSTTVHVVIDHAALTRRYCRRRDLRDPRRRAGKTSSGCAASWAKRS